MIELGWISLALNEDAFIESKGPLRYVVCFRVSKKI